MQVLDLLSKVADLNSVTMAHLSNIINVLCSKLEWIEGPSDQLEAKNEESNDQCHFTQLQNMGTHNTTPKIAQDETPNSQKIFKYFRGGIFGFGRSSKRSDKNGKTCDLIHPQICKKHEIYGDKNPKGCKNKKCDKLHLSVCKIFMRHQKRKYGDNCKYFLPKK